MEGHRRADSRSHRQSRAAHCMAEIGGGEGLVVELGVDSLVDQCVAESSGTAL